MSHCPVHHRDTNAFTPNGPTRAIARDTSYTRVPGVGTCQVLLTFPNSGQHVTNSLHLAHLVNVNARHFFSFIFCKCRGDLYSVVRHFKGNVNFLTYLFSLRRKRRISVAALGICSNSAARGVSPSFDMCSFSFSVNFPSTE